MGDKQDILSFPCLQSDDAFITTLSCEGIHIRIRYVGAYGVRVPCLELPVWGQCFTNTTAGRRPQSVRR